MMETAKLLLHCPDRPGILAEVTDFITVNKGNIIYLDQYVDHATGWKDKAEVKTRIEEVLKQVGMSSKGNKLPSELSGGEQQRVVIARAVLNSPEIILADEPTGNLDAETGRAITQLLHDISDSGTLVVMSCRAYNACRVRFVYHHESIILFG